jgi:type IV secretion system protein TrbI
MTTPTRPEIASQTATPVAPNLAHLSGTVRPGADSQVPNRSEMPSGPADSCVSALAGTAETSDPRAPKQSGASAVPVDPHAPKLSPDDPRLRLRRPASRTLRTGPIVVLVACVLGAGMLAVAFAFQSPSSTDKTRPSPSGVTAPPVVPDAIRNASAAPQTVSRPRPDAGPFRGETVERAPRPEDVRHRTDRERDVQAQGASILFETPAGAAEGDRAGEASRPPALMPTAPPSNGPGSPGAESDPNLQERKNAFLGGGGNKIGDSLGTTIQHPRSPYELQAGTILPTVLVTGINSDLPGPVIGQVRENVYDTVSGNYLLIPQGSRLLAQYDSMVSWGQERVLLCWHRLVLPNGDSLNLQCMPAADLAGAAGLTDQVDEHWFRIIKGAAVATLLAGTTQALAGNTTSFNPTVAQTWAGNAAGNINQVGQQLTRRDLNVQPTITVRPGYAVNVIVTKDIVLPPYPDPAQGRRP